MNYQTLLRSPIVPPKTIPLIEKASRNNAPVLILGEKGTGKELVARIIHHTGESQSRPFYRVDCKFMKEASFQDHLSLLSKPTSDRSAPGTVFLKEIGSLAQASQFHLLEVVESGLFQLGAGGDSGK